jgi:hypothetical protein
MGEQQVKNIARPVRMYQVRDLAVLIEQLLPTSPQPLPLPDKPSIAVLPFTNMSGDPEQGYFADGIAEDIITALSHYRSLFVIARNSSLDRFPDPAQRCHRDPIGALAAIGCVQHQWHIAGVRRVDPDPRWAVSDRAGFEVDLHRAFRGMVRRMAADAATNPIMELILTIDPRLVFAICSACSREPARRDEPISYRPVGVVVSRMRTIRP